MLQVKGYSKEYYIEQCKEEGGEPVEYKDMAEAAEALRKILEKRFGKRATKDLTAEKVTDKILDDTNCDWIAMDDGTVLYRKYRRTTKRG